ncbi:RNA-directed RNA polymerase Rdp1 [Schizosaccharomyces cryophilus OY26]|uniref:RNA-dependent RNA polymerase n=1 Tax=Schizosaccharomyces cryophilus (strain OY26 / ATCC MYA-4695 / CBS 11777 / NBRC 106824 / NRRL Y48691) TaxID=653667 RepID=S9VSP7_SCHCR|nr:RNA-directed RNA polymerase Rdp1 [Schizosaccharomyces cryophilus OY26]EPY50913.1 RNA-directed RNA polymerase Rdp1 [Schizosaccharomyces cryophilus OY26]
MDTTLRDFIGTEVKTYYRESPWERLKVPFKQAISPIIASQLPRCRSSSSGGRRPNRSNVWRFWDSLTLTVFDIPSEWIEENGNKLYNLWKPLHKHGNISFMKFIEPPNNNLTTTAIVRFFPPPRDPFWQPFNKIRVNGVDLNVRIDPYTQNSLTKQSSFTTVGNQYNKIVQLPLSSLTIGQSYHEKMVPLFGHECGTPLHDISLSVDFNNRRFMISFRIIAGEITDDYRLDINFRSVVDDIGIDVEKDSITLSFRYRLPPVLFRKELLESETKLRKVWSSSNLWRRQVDILPSSNRAVPNSPLQLLNSNNVPLGRSNMVMFSYDIRNSRSEEANAFFIEELEKYNLKSRMYRVSTYRIDGYSLRCELLYRNTDLSHTVLYLLETCLSQQLLSEVDLPVLLDNLNQLQEKRATVFLKNILASQKPLHNPTREIFTQQMAFFDLINTSSIRIRKLFVTPTTIRIVEDSIEAGNRVIRHYRQFADRFMRVQVADEFTKRKVYADNSNCEAVFARVLQLLDQGVKVGNRIYEFLAFGNSQLREHGAFFFASGPDLNVEDIRKWMGDFSEINSVSKYAARMGQCFSTTKDIDRFSVNIAPRNDIYKNNNCFTDGIGMASLSVLRRLSFEIDDNELFPSAFQFRMGGYKGVLSLAPPTKLEYHQGDLVFPRPSQDKFKSPHAVLEVIKVSRFLNARLNMQIITLLEGLGVQQDVFLEMAKNQLSELNNAMTNKQKCILMLRDNVDENRSTLVMADLIQSGFLEKNDIFTKNLLNLYYEWVLKSIKEKQKLNVSKGAYLFGVADETGTLKGHCDDAVLSIPEIFVQVTNHHSEAEASSTGRIKTTVILGLCVVARNPSLHPGDIRVCRAIRSDDLMHLKNVVVFPTKGDRSVPAMCSGGDLDGDEYTVIWDPSLLPKIVNYPPLLETTRKHAAKFLDGKPLIDSVKAFFICYIKNDNLGLISNAWKAWAHDKDNNPDGIYGQTCLKLAALHSQAVDFPKSGIACTMPKELRPKQYPDFMQKQRSRTFKAETAVGRIFQYAAKFQKENEGIRKFDPNMEMVYDDRMKLPKYKLNYLHIAEEVKERYDFDMKALMNRYEIASEYEVYTAFILLNDDMKTSINEYGVREEIMLQFSIIKKAYVNEYFEKCGLSTSCSNQDNKARIDSAVAAAYDVTYKQRLHSLRNGKRLPLISFPYIFVNILCRIAHSAAISN